MLWLNKVQVVVAGPSRTPNVGNSKVVQWLRLLASTAGDMGSFPGQEQGLSHATWCGQKKKVKNAPMSAHPQLPAFWAAAPAAHGGTLQVSSARPQMAAQAPVFRMYLGCI